MFDSNWWKNRAVEGLSVLTILGVCYLVIKFSLFFLCGE